MRDQKKKLGLLLDTLTGTAHYFPAVKLTNVQLRYLRPNATSVVQPLDKGIINSAKCAYKCRVVEKFLLNLELKRVTKVDVFTTTDMVTAAQRGMRVDKS